MILIAGINATPVAYGSPALVGGAAASEGLGSPREYEETHL